MYANILVRPEQRNDDVKNKFCSNLKEIFYFPLPEWITIVLFKPQGRPLDGINENLSEVFTNPEHRKYLLIIVHDMFISDDILYSLEGKWKCDVIHWRNDDDWDRICKYLGGCCEKKSRWVKLKERFQSCIIWFSSWILKPKPMAIISVILTVAGFIYIKDYILGQPEKNLATKTTFTS